VLLAPVGQALLAELIGLELTPETELALARRLRAVYPADLVTAALSMHELRQRARPKFTRADRMYLTRDGLEQASAEPLARHRAARLAGVGKIADLCCGIGGDLVALAGGSEPASEVLAVDRDPIHLRMAVLNACVYEVGEAVRTVCVDVRSVDLVGVDVVFVDPARRIGSRRLATGPSEPPLSWCIELAERVGVVVKAAPGIDRDRVPAGWEVEFVSAGRELKEAVLWSPAFVGAPGVTSRASVLPSGEQLRAVPGEPVECRAPGAYLLDPNPAVTRAGLVEDLARGLGAWKIDPMIAFLSSDRPLRSPFARTLRVLDSGPWREKELASRLRSLGVGSVEIRRRGLAGDVDTLRRRLRLPPGQPATLVMTRVADRPWALICVDA